MGPALAKCHLVEGLPTQPTSLPESQLGPNLSSEALPLPVILGLPSATRHPCPALLRPALRFSGPRVQVVHGGVTLVTMAMSGASLGAVLGTRPDPQLCHLHCNFGQRR